MEKDFKSVAPGLYRRLEAIVSQFQEGIMEGLQESLEAEYGPYTPLVSMIHPPLRLPQGHPWHTSF